MAFHRSANNSPRLSPVSIATPAIALASGGKSASSAAAWAVVNTHLGRTVLSVGRSTPRAGLSCSVTPLHRSAKHGAQDIVDVVDRLGCVACLREMRHVRLHLLPRDIRNGLLAKLGHQVLRRDMRWFFCVDGLYIGSTVACQSFTNVRERDA
jgi:hypothetical protein